LWFLYLAPSGRSCSDGAALYQPLPTGVADRGQRLRQVKSAYLKNPSAVWNESESPCFLKSMTDNQNLFANFDLEHAIALRWALRDIKGKRLKLSPVSESDLSTLTNLGLVEMRDDVPVLTQAGHDALD
jgi:hypothetical protein